MKGDTVEIITFGEVDQRAYEQLVRCGEAGAADYGVLCGDHHVGYSQPIGGAIAYRDFISPSGVGFDIGCGNKAVKTNLLATHIKPKKIMDEIFRQISFGVGRSNAEPVDHPVLDKIARAEFAPQRKMIGKAAAQLGTVGAGNHYVDLFKDEEGCLWIGVHFGSRGFGHGTASGFLAMAQNLDFEDRAREGDMDSPPVLFHTSSHIGQAYIEAMHLAGEYAYAGRDIVVAKVLEILGARAIEEVHNHHNFAWREEHFGEEYWVVRKGCTPAFPGQKGFVGATMRDDSVILEGIEDERSTRALYSTVHGAGRVMSRTQAAGKWTKVNGKRVRAGGLVDWNAVVQDMRERGIELRGAGADEAPQAYKPLSEVLASHAGTIRILHELTPIGVAMAGSGVYDPYKD